MNGLEFLRLAANLVQSYPLPFQGSEFQPARTVDTTSSMRQFRYRILPLRPADGMSFEVVVCSDTEANARRQLAAQFPSDRFQVAYLGEVR